MTTLLRNTFVRSLLILIMGGALIVYSDIAPTLIVQALGVLFIIPGLVTTLSAFSKRDSGAPMLPSVVGGGRIFFGAILLLLPNLFIGILMYLLAALLILAGGMQLLRLVQIGRDGLRVNLIYFLFPIVTLLVGMYVLMQPKEAAGIPFKIIGYAAVIYALIDLLLAIKAYFFHRALRKAQQKAEAANNPEAEATPSTTEPIPAIEANEEVQP